MTLDEAKAKLERVARDKHKQYSAAFKLALLKVLDRVTTLEDKNSGLKLALKYIRNDTIGQPDSTYVRRVNMHVDSVLGSEDEE